jgi:hypothetical protein
MKRVVVWVIASTLVLCAAACVDGGGPLTPSPVIVPDAITIRAGETQTFVVHNATVVSFAVSRDRGDWTRVASLEATDLVANSVRVRALQTTADRIFVTANLGRGRSPLVAVMEIR